MNEWAFIKLSEWKILSFQMITDFATSLADMDPTMCNTLKY